MHNQQPVDAQPQPVNGSKENLWQLFAHTSNPVLLIDAEGAYVDGNEAALSFLECSYDELLTKNIYDFIVPAEREEVAQTHPALWRTGGVIETNYLVHGVVKPIELVLVPLTIKQKHYCLGVGLDVTQRRRTETALQESNKRFQEMAESIREVFWLYDLDRQKTLYISPAYEQVIGETPTWINEGGELSFLNLVHPEDQAQLRSARSAFLKRGAQDVFHETFRIIRPDGQVRWIQARVFPVQDENGRVYRLAGVADDITNLKQAEEINRQQHSLADTLVKTAQAINQTLDLEKVIAVILKAVKPLAPHDGANIMILDPDRQTMRLANYCQCYDQNGLPRPRIGAAWPLLQFPHLQHLVQTGQPLFIPDTKIHETWVDTLHSANIRSYIGIPILVDNEVIGILNLDSQTPNFFQPEHVARVQMLAPQAAIAIRNAQLHQSVQKQLAQLQDTQARLIQNEKLAAIGELVAGIAHELNNPLASVILYAQLLQYRQKLGADNKEIQQIVAQAERASAIVRSLLDFARQRPPDQAPTQINALLQETLSLLAYELRRHNVEPVLNLDPHLPPVLADPQQLQQVFVNLITNALQAMRAQGQGHLWVSTTVDFPDASHLPTMPQPVVRLVIRDDGPGVPPELQPRIFDPFFTTKPEGQGTGLGLSVCHGIITEHQGKIWLESDGEQGAAFYVELPVGKFNRQAQLPQDDAVADTPAKQWLPAARILVVDDELSIQEALSRVLGNYDVDVAGDGREALEKIAVSSYDLIICDILMPRMDGVEMHKRLVKEYPNLIGRVVFMTGDTMSCHANEYLQQSEAMILAKPFDIASLTKAVQGSLIRP